MARSVKKGPFVDQHLMTKVVEAQRIKSKKVLKTWTDKLAVPTLKPGERTEFTSRFEAPPVETYRLTVTFAYPDGEDGGKETQVEATHEPAAAGREGPAAGGHDMAQAEAAKTPATEPPHEPAASAGEPDDH